jgi:hypothetical protein
LLVTRDSLSGAVGPFLSSDIGDIGTYLPFLGLGYDSSVRYNRWKSRELGWDGGDGGEYWEMVRCISTAEIPLTVAWEVGVVHTSSNPQSPTGGRKPKVRRFERCRYSKEMLLL